MEAGATRSGLLCSTAVAGWKRARLREGLIMHRSSIAALGRRRACGCADGDRDRRPLLPGEVALAQQAEDAGRRPL
jgi:hypothetical protein